MTRMTGFLCFGFTSVCLPLLPTCLPFVEPSRSHSPDDPMPQVCLSPEHMLSKQIVTGSVMLDIHVRERDLWLQRSYETM